MTELLPDVLVRLSQERPKLQVRVVARNRELFTDLLEGRFNLVVAMLYDEIRSKDCRSSGCSDDRLVLVMRPDHPLAKRRKVKPNDLLDQKWVFADSDTWPTAAPASRAGRIDDATRADSKPQSGNSEVHDQRSHRHDLEAWGRGGSVQGAAQVHRDQLAADG